MLDTTIAGVGIQATAIAILNEQDIAADESDISVNALRITITLTATLLAVELTQDLEIIVARSRAGFINCNTVDLEIAKTTDLGGENATVGEPFNYTVTITNSDAVNEATAVAFTDQLPAEVDFDAFGTITGGGDCEYDADNHTIICQWLTIPADTSVSATYQVTPNTATAPDAASNIAVVTTGDEDPEPDNNSASVDVIIEPTENQADLAIEKDVSATEVTVGEEFSYTLTVTNNGPDTAILVVVTDTLPAQVQFVSATPEGACTETAGVVSCELGNLADQEEVIIVLTVLAVSAGTASNTATVDAASTDPNPDDNTAGPVDTTIQPPPDLSVTLAGPTTGVVGDPAEYTATVTNNLDETVEDVELVIEIPDGMSLDEGSVSATGGGICTIASITCNWDSIAGDGSVVVSFTLIPNMVGPQLLEATVGTEADGDLDSDQLTISILAATGRGDPRAIPTLSFYGMLVFLLLLGFLVLRGGRVNHR